MVLSVLDTWEAAVAEADRLVQELYDDGIAKFRDENGLPSEFVEMR